MERGLWIDVTCGKLGTPGFESWLSGEGVVISKAFLGIPELPFLLAQSGSNCIDLAEMPQVSQGMKLRLGMHAGDNCHCFIGFIIISIVHLPFQPSRGCWSPGSGSLDFQQCFADHHWQGSPQPGWGEGTQVSLSSFSVFLSKTPAKKRISMPHSFGK